jgi:ADP-heptose:LPS heptosyltransferase
MAIEIREKTSDFFTGQSRRTSLVPESLPITAVLRDPKNILLVPGSHIEDIILTEPFISSLKDKYPECCLTVVVRESLSTLADEIDLVDTVIPTSLSDSRAGSGKVMSFSRELSSGAFDIAMAVSHEAESTIGLIVSHSGAGVRIGFESMVRKGVSLNVLFRDSGEAEPFSRRIQNLFSLLGVERPRQFSSNITRVIRGKKNGLDFLRGRQGEQFIGFFFDQADPLDRMSRRSVVDVVRTVVDRRNEKCIAAGFGMAEQDFKVFTETGVRILEDRTLIELTGAYSDCSWTVTNSLGFAALLGQSGSRVIYLGDPSRLRKLSLSGMRDVTFLSTSVGNRFYDSLLRIMEEKYPGE